jgi:hypothetical protein
MVAGPIMSHAYLMPCALMAFATLVLRVQSDDVPAPVSSDEPVRDYVAGVSIANFYRPQNIKFTGVGIVNQDTAYFSTRWGIGELQTQIHWLHRVIDHDEVTAFHLCHHRNSVFYEVESQDGGSVTIHELSLVFQKEFKVVSFDDASPATSLACVDDLLLRASSSNVIAVNVAESEEPEHEEDKKEPVWSVLFEYDHHDQSDVITSLATSYAADVFTKAQVFALIPHNRTLLRVHLESDDHHSGHITAQSEILLEGGDGSDGAIQEASTYEPLHVLSVHDTILFADGCSLRQIADGYVKTVVGSPADCVEPQNETVEPVPWASRLSKPEALAGAAEETAEGAVLALTGAGIFRMTHADDTCTPHTEAEDCAGQHGCGWAAGAKSGEHMCLSCEALQAWASGESMEDVCTLEYGPRASTTYNLVGCGCVVVTTTPEPEPAGGSFTALHVVLVLFVLVAVCCVLLMFHRASRRAAAMREIYGAESCEFHIFTDEESR